MEIFQGKDWSGFALKVSLADGSKEFGTFRESVLEKLKSLQNDKNVDPDLVDYLILLLNEKKVLSEVAGEINELMVDDSSATNEAITTQLFEWVYNYLNGDKKSMAQGSSIEKEGITEKGDSKKTQQNNTVAKPKATEEQNSEGARRGTKKRPAETVSSLEKVNNPFIKQQSKKKQRIERSHNPFSENNKKPGISSI